MLASVCSGVVVGLKAYRVDVEVDIGRGMVAFHTVGLPHGAVCEARTRIKSALDNCGYGFPQRRVTVNLAPANIRKEGTFFDLPMALGLLAADGKIPADALAGTLVCGELSLDGRLRAVRGVLPLAVNARRLGMAHIIVPADNAGEAALVPDIRVLAADHLTSAVEALTGGAPLPEATAAHPGPRFFGFDDLAEVRGQEVARRALEIAAAGGHNLLLIGPPGAGKSMLAQRMRTILAPMSFEEQLECSTIRSVAGLLRPETPLVCERPFRAPHYCVSAAALTGGGPMARPGEISLAHNGVLFLDELPEFRRDALEALRGPLEDGRVLVCRARQSLSYPASFTLIAAMNPCPCGYSNHPTRSCSDHPAMVQKYRNRISGPLRDRFDLQVALEPVGAAAMRDSQPGESSLAVRTRVVGARQRQQERLGRGEVNGRMRSAAIQQHCQLDPAGDQVLRGAMERLGLSPRGHDKVLRVARTIADLEGAQGLAEHHICEALQYRCLDREAFG